MCFTETDIFLPKEAHNPDFMTKWSVIACDQFTSDISYWNKTKDFTGNDMSALNLIFPEIYLEIEPDAEQAKRIKNITETMKKYENDLVCHKNSMFYIERKLKNGSVRRGLVGAVDLEEYDYKKESTAKIRATEEAVPARIPPRIKIRENALFELPHVMILYNDEKDILMSQLNKNIENFTKAYDFDLMQDSGKITGYNLDKKNIDFVKATLGSLEAENNGFLFAVGDGNHSLATAKECWENIKRGVPKEVYAGHPARYALAEIVNIYDSSLEFEPIYRVLIDVDPNHVIAELSKNFNDGVNEHSFEIYYGYDRLSVTIKSKYDLPVKTLQIFLDDYIKTYGGRIDYIHGKSETIEFAKQNNSAGFIFESIKKDGFFSAISKDGVLPRKTFSMGEACDKRFYTECRKIR